VARTDESSMQSDVFLPHACRLCRIIAPLDQVNPDSLGITTDYRMFGRERERAKQRQATNPKKGRATKQKELERGRHVDERDRESRASPGPVIRL
jgi:hypothetical protein